MKKEEILIKVIQKAVNNGAKKAEVFLDTNGKVMNCFNDDLIYYQALNYIFSHDFAKTFFPKKEKPNKNIAYQLILKGKEGWQYHLQQMIIEKNPIKYLEQFL